MENFSMFVESLKRLYKDKKVNKDKILSMKLTEKEKEYILT